MINLICEQLKTRLAALPYAEKTAGLVKIAVRRIEGESEDGTKYLLQEQRFPIAANVNGAECWRSGTYKDLAPNTSLKSVTYFEQVSPETITPETKPFTGTSVKLRLVGWFNLKKLGVTGELPPQIKYEIMSLLQNSVTVTIGARTENVRLNVNQVITDPSVFAKYSYEKAIIENMLLYPYSYFAIDFTATWLLQPNCYTFTPLTEIAC